MSTFVVIMQAKKSIYFMPLKEDEPPMPFMIKGQIRVMRGKMTTRSGYEPIEHNDENFRFFIPVDMTKGTL